MLTRGDLQRLSDLRFDDAVLLLRANRSSSAYYLAGYAVELALKSCIARLFQPDVIPDKAFVNALYTHKFSELVSLAGLRPNFDSSTKADTQLAANWAIANNWNEGARYQLWDPVSASTLLQAIGDPQHGVLQWVKQHW